MGRAFCPSAVRYWTAAGLMSNLFILEGCTTTPSIRDETTQVPVSQIVERVKCEIWLATKDRLADKDFAFLKKWDATVDLTLMVNDQSGISPGVSIINPLNSVTLANKGTFGQSFSLGLGGGVTGQANLSDTVSFSLSLRELAYSDTGLNNAYKRSQYYRACVPLQENDLIGKLRFKEWIDQALSPVRDPDNDYKYLTRGPHPTVQAGGGAHSMKVAALNEARFKLGALKETIATASVPEDDKKTKTATINDVQNKITPENLDAHPQVLDNLIAEHQDNKSLSVILKDLQKKFAEANKPPVPVKRATGKTAQLNDPLDTISHQIQFIVTWNASATPSWSLVNVKGPGPATGTFLSAQRQTTHQLLITMGPVKSEIASVRSFQQFGAALRSSPVTVVPQ